MARLVIGAGSSHGPGIQRPVELWQELGERDRRDPRFRFDDLLKDGPRATDLDLELSTQRRRQSNLRAALETLSGRIAEAKPDVAIIVSNAHVVQREHHRPVFSIMRAKELPFVESSGVTYEDDGGDAALHKVDGHPALADHLIETLNQSGFDIGCRDGFPEGERLDEAFAFCYRWMFKDKPIPTIPFYLSRDLPGQPYPARCIELGKALRESIEAFPLDLRVALVSSGGLSHQIVDEQLDRSVIEALCDGVMDELKHLDRTRLNRSPGTPEILNWITVGSAMAPGKLDLLTYEPCFRSIGGTGFGGAVGSWPATHQ